MRDLLDHLARAPQTQSTEGQARAFQSLVAEGRRVADASSTYARGGLRPGSAYPGLYKMGRVDFSDPDPAEAYALEQRLVAAGRPRIVQTHWSGPSKKRAQYNPFTHTMFAPVYEKVFDELPHAEQRHDLGLVPMALWGGLGLVLGRDSDWAAHPRDPRPNRYHTPGFLEHDAHHVRQPELESEVREAAGPGRLLRALRNYVR